MRPSPSAASLPAPLAAALCIAAVASPLAAQAPSTDVFVAPLEMQGKALRVGTPRNVTNRDGYDNQPSFSPDGRTLYYTATRDDAQADIYRLDLASGRAQRVTTTAPESEYSAVVTPSGDALSVIRVERDSTQRLWHVPLDGGASTVIVAGVKPVGYHAWANDHLLALFVLGAPPTLQLADLRTGRVDTVATAIGRSLHRIPGTSRVSFVSKADSAEWWVVELEAGSPARRRLARLPRGVEDYAWLPDGRMIAGNGSKLFVTQAGNDFAWDEVADLSAAGIGEITRLAVSPLGDRIAIVGVPTRR